MRRLFAVSGSFCLACVLLCGGGTAGRPHPGAVSDDPIAPQRPVGKLEFGWECNGEVLELAPRSVTVRGMDFIVTGGKGELIPGDPTGLIRVGRPGDPVLVRRGDRSIVGTGERVVWKRESLSITDADGVETVLRLADQPARRFVPGPAFENGGVPKTAGPPNTYRPSDLQVGDWVRIDYRRIGGVDYIDAILLRWRPGADIPPAPREGDIHPHPHPWHERVNASRAWEERGTIPPAHLAGFLVFHNGPVYPKGGFPTAPMPREVRPKP